MQEFLDRFAATIAQDEHVALVLDQAGWHGSAALIVPDNVTLVPLPPILAGAEPGRARVLDDSGPLASTARRLRGHRRCRLSRLEPPRCRHRPHHPAGFVSLGYCRSSLRWGGITCRHERPSQGTNPVAQHGARTMKPHRRPPRASSRSRRRSASCSAWRPARRSWPRPTASAPGACSSPPRARWRRRRRGRCSASRRRWAPAHVGTFADHQRAQPARGRGGGRGCGARRQGRPAGGRRRRLGDRCHQGHATLPLARPRQPRGHGALLRRLRPLQGRRAAPASRTRSAWSRCPPRCRPPSSRRTPASPSRRPTPSNPSATACSRRAPWCSIPPPRSIRRTGCCSARASAPSTMRWRPTATRARIRRPRRCPCRACGCSPARCRRSSKPRASWRPGWRPSSACGRRLRRPPRASRPGPATASAMRWAPASASPTATPPA